MQALYSALQGIAAQQQKIDTIANNVANVGTYGYKSQSVCFKDTLYTNMINAADIKSIANLKQGTGVAVSSAYRNYTQGTPVSTGINLDFMIDGDGFFTVSGNDGMPLYTKSGSFAVSNEQDGNYLVTAQGRYVLDTNLDFIKLPDNTEELSVSENGELYVGDNDTFAKLNIVTFVNKDGLLETGDCCYAQTKASGDALETDAKVSQGYLESSNTNLNKELTNLIRAQMAMSLASRAVTTWDDMEAATNNLRT